MRAASGRRSTVGTIVDELDADGLDARHVVGCEQLVDVGAEDLERSCPVALAELEDGLFSHHAVEAIRAQVAQVVPAEQPRGDPRRQRLPAMAGGGEARRGVHGRTEVGLEGPQAVRGPAVKVACGRLTVAAPLVGYSTRSCPPSVR